MDDYDLKDRARVSDIAYANLVSIGSFLHARYHPDPSNVDEGYRIDNVIDGKVDSFVTFKRVKAAQPVPVHSDFLSQSSRIKAKFHISLHEDHIAAGWDAIQCTLVEARLNYFKVIKPNSKLSQMSPGPQAKFSYETPKREKGTVYFEIETRDQNSKHLKLIILNRVEKKTLTISFNYLQQQCGIQETVLNALAENPTEPLTISVKAILLKILADYDLIEPLDQCGKDITIYMTSNLEKGREEWSRVIADITRQLISHQIPPGYYTSESGERADVHVPGLNYVSYRYENTSEDVFGLRQILTTAAEQLQQEQLQQPEPIRTRPWVPECIQNLAVFSHRIPVGEPGLNLATETFSSEQGDEKPKQEERSRRPLLQPVRKPPGISPLKLPGTS